MRLVPKVKPQNLQQFFDDTRYLSTRDLLLILLFNQLEELDRMGALEDALANEQTVIDEVVALVQSFGNFAAQLQAAQEALAALQVVDNQDKADLQAALDSAQIAVQTVSQQTGQLQALVTPAPAPEPVVEPAPADVPAPVEPPADVPVEEVPPPEEPSA